MSDELSHALTLYCMCKVMTSFDIVT